MIFQNVIFALDSMWLKCDKYSMWHNLPMPTEVRQIPSTTNCVWTDSGTFSRVLLADMMVYGFFQVNALHLTDLLFRPLHNRATCGWSGGSASSSFSLSRKEELLYSYYAVQTRFAKCLKTTQKFSFWWAKQATLISLKPWQMLFCPLKILLNFVILQFKKNRQEFLRILKGQKSIVKGFEINVGS